MTQRSYPPRGPAKPPSDRTLSPVRMGPRAWPKVCHRERGTASIHRSGIGLVLPAAVSDFVRIGLPALTVLSAREPPDRRLLECGPPFPADVITAGGDPGARAESQPLHSGRRPGGRAATPPLLRPPLPEARHPHD